MTTDPILAGPLPCGCEISTGLVNGDQTFVLRACRDDCPTVQLMLEAADEAGKPVEIRNVMTMTVTCLGCGRILDAATVIEGDTILPDPGAISICWYCACVAVYERNPDGDLYLRLPTGAEQVALAGDTLINDAIAMIRNPRRPPR